MAFAIFTIIGSHVNSLQDLGLKTQNFLNYFTRGVVEEFTLHFSKRRSAHVTKILLRDAQALRIAPRQYFWATSNHCTYFFEIQLQKNKYR